MVNKNQCIDKIQLSEQINIFVDGTLSNKTHNRTKKRK